MPKLISRLPVGAASVGAATRRDYIGLSTLLVLLVMLAGLQIATAQVNPGTQWRQAVTTDLDVDFGGTGFHARWKFQRCQCGDLRVQVEQIDPDGVQTGELLMVSGQVLLARGFSEQDADIEPLIQAPSLMLQMVFELLGRSQPLGPSAVDEKQVWIKAEDKLDLKLDTGLATGIFPAPWAVEGSGWSTQEDHRRFELSFRFANPLPGNPGARDSITFSGDLDFDQREFPYSDSTNLGGWRVQWLAVDDREAEAVPDGLTLKELRQQIKDL